MGFVEMSPLEKDYLKLCNGFGRDVGTNWMPYIKRDDQYYTPSGLLAYAPQEWRAASHDEIVAEMNERGEIPMPDLNFARSAMVH